MKYETTLMIPATIHYKTSKYGPEIDIKDVELYGIEIPKTVQESILEEYDESLQEEIDADLKDMAAERDMGL